MTTYTKAELERMITALEHANDALALEVEGLTQALHERDEELTRLREGRA